MKKFLGYFAGILALAIVPTLSLQIGTALSGSITVSPFGFSRVVTQVFTSNGTYTPTSGMVYVILECQGSGGGGGGVTGALGTMVSGGGGGSGAYGRSIQTAAQIGASQTVTIGAAGAGGTAGNNAGSNGATTSVGTLCTAGGGSGGGWNSGLVFIVSQYGNGGTAGTGNVVAIAGRNGEIRVATTAASTYDIGGSGGSSWFGAGGIGQLVASGANPGGAGTGYGSGGAGATEQNANGTTAAGGNGTAGIVVATEFVR